MDPARRRASAVRAVTVAAGVLAVFGLFGQALLTYAGISLDAFRISGGVLLFLIAVEMLFERRTQRRDATAQSQLRPAHRPRQRRQRRPGRVPRRRAAGGRARSDGDHGAAGVAEGGVLWQVSVLAVTALVLGIVLTLFLIAARIGHLIGPAAINVLTRLFGILLAALAIQIVLDGLAGYGLAPVGPDSTAAARPPPGSGTRTATAGPAGVRAGPVHLAAL